MRKPGNNQKDTYSLKRKDCRREVIWMNIYLETLNNDITELQGLSHVCRGQWCRILEPEVDILQNELIEMRIVEGDFEPSAVDEMSGKLRDAYRHLARDIYFP